MASPTAGMFSCSPKIKPSAPNGVEHVGPEQQLDSLELRDGQIVRGFRQMLVEKSGALVERQIARAPEWPQNGHLKQHRAGRARALIDDGVGQKPQVRREHKDRRPQRGARPTLHDVQIGDEAGCRFEQQERDQWPFCKERLRRAANPVEHWAGDYHEQCEEACGQKGCRELRKLFLREDASDVVCRVVFAKPRGGKGR